MKSRRVRWAMSVTATGNSENCAKLLLENEIGRDVFDDPDADCRVNFTTDFN
jgi:hypothetical protein